MESPKPLPTRAELDLDYTWNLAATYATEAEFQADFQALSGSLDQLAAFQGRLGESAATLADFFDLYWATLGTIQKLGIYSNMPVAVDQGDQEARARAGRF